MLMSCNDNRYAGRGKGTEEINQRVGIGFIEMSHRFVGKNQYRAVDDGTGQTNQLPLSGRECSRLHLCQVCDTALAEGQKCSAFGFGNGFISGKGREHYVFDDAALV